MIDEFYDRKVKIILSADALIEKLCKVTKLESEFKRTESRISDVEESNKKGDDRGDAGSA